MPDLRIVGLEVAPSVVPVGRPASIRFMVHNAGTRAASGSIIVRAVHGARWPQPLPGDVELVFLGVDELVPVEMEIAAGLVPSAPVELLVAVDAEGAVEESNERDNVATVGLVPCDGPDAEEVRDGRDNDCDGEVDENVAAADAAARLERLRRDQRAAMRALIPPVVALPEPASPWSTARPARLRSSAGQYVVAEQGGGGVVRADRSEAERWETFRLVDLDGGELVDGDAVSFATWDGIHWLVAPGGGGNGLVASEAAWPWSRVFILSRRAGPGRVVDGDEVSLRTPTGHFVVAEQGGGGEVSADRPDAGPWESFVVELVFEEVVR